ncbi:MAG TPA: hypothetical protein VF858_14385 [Gemmatimonadaceae bacterium]
MSRDKGGNGIQEVVSSIIGSTNKINKTTRKRHARFKRREQFRPA